MPKVCLGEWGLSANKRYTLGGVNAQRPQMPTLSVTGRSTEAGDEEEVVESLGGHLVDFEYVLRSGRSS